MCGDGTTEFASVAVGHGEHTGEDREEDLDTLERAVTADGPEVHAGKETTYQEVREPHRGVEDGTLDSRQCSGSAGADEHPLPAGEQREGRERHSREDEDELAPVGERREPLYLTGSDEAPRLHVAGREPSDDEGDNSRGGTVDMRSPLERPRTYITYRYGNPDDSRRRRS